MTAPRPTREQAQRPSTQRAIRAEAESMPIHWLDSLSGSDCKRVDEVCGLLAEKGTELGGPWSDHLDGPVWKLRLRLRDVAAQVTHWCTPDGRIVLQPAVDPGKDTERHAPVLDRTLDIVKRGQASGDFDATVPAHWLLSAILALGRAAEDEVKAGRMTTEQATSAIQQGVLRLLGAR